MANDTEPSLVQSRFRYFLVDVVTIASEKNIKKNCGFVKEQNATSFIKNNFLLETRRLLQSCLILEGHSSTLFNHHFSIIGCTRKGLLDKKGSDHTDHLGSGSSKHSQNEFPSHKSSTHSQLVTTHPQSDDV